MNWKLIINENNQLIASNAFAIIMQEDDTYFDNSRVQCARFKGVNRAQFIDKKEFTGPIINLIEKTFNFIISHIHVGMKINGLYSCPNYEIDPYIIRELLDNAFHHRNYMDDSAIQVSIYDDRLEIVSPGSIFNNLSLTQILSGRTSSRNKVLTRFFKEMGLIEEWGSGLQRVIELCKQTGLPEPKFEDLDTAFRVTIYRNVSHTNYQIPATPLNIAETNSIFSEVNAKGPYFAEAQPNLALIEKNLSKAILEDLFTNIKDIKRCLKLIHYLLNNASITIKEAMPLLELQDRSCRMFLKRCEKFGILNSIGSTTNMKYYLYQE